MRTEEIIARLALESGYSLSTARRWWRRERTRPRTHRDMSAAAKKLKVRRPAATGAQ